MLPSFRKSISNREENSVLLISEDTHVSSTAPSQSILVYIHNNFFLHG